jgi:hypothetical protein
MNSPVVTAVITTYSVVVAHDITTIAWACAATPHPEGHAHSLLERSSHSAVEAAACVQALKETFILLTSPFRITKQMGLRRGTERVT